MNCEEFEILGLDARRDSALSEVEVAAAREHASSCPQCAALQDSWFVASEELRIYGASMQAVNTPVRVEMRLRQEFRTRHQTQRHRRAALIAGWALATAAVLVGAVNWIKWREAQPGAIAKQEIHSPDVSKQTAGAGELQNAANLAAVTDADSFTYLPGTIAAELDDTAIVRVNMKRGTLAALGIPVNEDRADEWVQVDLLVSDDGLPQAVRLPQ